MPIITCARCTKTNEKMAFRPYNNDLGLRVFNSICQPCWAEWLKTQTQLINHYGLDVRDPKAKEFLFEKTEEFLFSPPPE